MAEAGDLAAAGSLRGFPRKGDGMTGAERPRATEAGDRLGVGARPGPVLAPCVPASPAGQCFGPARSAGR